MFLRNRGSEGCDSSIVLIVRGGFFCIIDE